MRERGGWEVMFRAPSGKLEGAVQGSAGGKGHPHCPCLSVSKGQLVDRSVILWAVREPPLPFCCILLNLLHDVGPEACPWI